MITNGEGLSGESKQNIIDDIKTNQLTHEIALYSDYEGDYLCWIARFEYGKAKPLRCI